MWIIIPILWIAWTVFEWQFIKHNPKITGIVNAEEAKAIADLKAKKTATADTKSSS